MQTLQFARARIAAVLTEIERLKHSEFAYAHSEHALKAVEGIFKRSQDTLSRLSEQSSPDILNNECGLSLKRLFIFHPILGFILRSTNARNAFEIYAPLLRLARQTLSPDAKLLLSSEWDFSPFVYSMITDLPEYSMIGIPASESSNPLLVPLAGHELGHTYWKLNSLAKRFSSNVEALTVNTIRGSRWADFNQVFPHFPQKDIDTNLFARNSWQPAYTFAMLQIEEIFCDALGVLLFAESYLCAFAYLIAPRLPGMRSPSYPNLTARAHYICSIASALGVTPPSDFVAAFEDMDAPSDPARKVLTAIADDVVAIAVPGVVALIRDIDIRDQLPRRNHDVVKEIASDFRLIVPTERTSSITDITNAAWLCYNDPDLWSTGPDTMDGIRKLTVLRELVLKSFEILEVQERTREPI